MTPQRDFGASLSELKDTKRAVTIQRDRYRSYMYLCAAFGVGAVLAGFGQDASIGWWIAGAFFFGASGIFGLLGW